MSPLRSITSAFDRWRDIWSLTVVQLVGDRMSREATALQAGQSEARRRIVVSRRSFALLRRAIHRLDKGLTMQPRAAVFALDYIDEAIEHYLAATEAGVDLAELAWAADVLSEFFAVTAAHPRLQSARLKFESAQSASVAQGRRRIPFPYSKLNTTSVAYADLFSLARRRKSVRWFLNREVPLNLVREALELGLQAPSACNRQPYLFRIILDSARAQRVAKIAMGTAGYSQNVPCLVVVLGDFSAFEHSRDRHLPYIDASLAAMQFMLALETLGLASCPINWPDIEKLERRMDRELRLPAHLRPVMLIAVGYADPSGLVAYSQRRAVDDVMRLTDDYLP